MKFFRIIFATSLILIIASTSLFVSAEVVEGEDKVYPFDLEWVQIDFIASDGTVVPVSVTVDGNEVNAGRVRCSMRRKDGKDFLKNEKYKVLLTMKIDIEDEHTLNYYSGEYCVAASYRLSVSTASAINVSQNNYAARSDIGYARVTEDGKYTYNAYNVVTVNYPYSDIGDQYVLYMNQFQITFNSHASVLTLNVYQVEFTAITEAEKFLGEKIDSATSSIIANQDENTAEITSNQDKNASQIMANQDKNTDKIVNAGSNVSQPDFGSTNNQIDNTTTQMNNLEGEYQIDQAATTETLNEGQNFLKGSDMQLASIQVKTWIERFTSDNKVIGGFLVSIMCLGLCFWVIGRKAARSE